MESAIVFFAQTKCSRDFLFFPKFVIDMINNFISNWTLSRTVQGVIVFIFQIGLALHARPIMLKFLT